MRNKMICGGIGALCVLALAGQATVRADMSKQAEAKTNEVKADDKPVTMTLLLKTGDTVQYKNTFTVSLGDNDIDLEQNRKRTVKEVKDNGDVMVLFTDLGGKYTVNGADNAVPAGSSVTLTQNKYGKILTYLPEKDENPYLSLSTLHLIAMSECIVFPDKPVKIGDSWTTQVDNPAVKDKKVILKTTLVGTEKTDGVAALKVKQTLEADTADGDKMTTELTALLDAANGQLIQADQTAKHIPGQMGPIDWKGKLQRVKPEADKAAKKPDAA